MLIMSNVHIILNMLSLVLISLHVFILSLPVTLRTIEFCTSKKNGNSYTII